MKNKNIYLILIMLIVMLGTFARNYKIENKGLFFYDEGIYLCSAKAKYLNFIHKLGINEKITEKDHLLKQYMGKPSPNFASGSKIGFVFFIFLSFLFFGINSYSSLIVSVFFGSLTILLVYLITRRIYNENTALLASLILAVSPMHIMYSRCGFSQSASIFFLFLGFYFYIVFLGNKKYIYSLLCATCIGFSFTVHYNLLLFLPLFLFLEMFRLIFVNKEKKRKFLKSAAFAASLILPVILWQILTAVDHTYKLGFFSLTYFDELKISFTAIAGQVKNKPDPFFFLYYFQKMEGWIVFLFFIIGIFYLIKRLRKNFNMKEFVLIILALFPIVWYGFYPHLRVLRSFAPALPAAAIIASYAIINFCDFPKIKYFGKLLITVFIITLFTANIFGFLPILSLKSSYAEIVKDIYVNNDIKLLSDEMEMYPVFAYYMGDDVIGIKEFSGIKKYTQAKTLINIFSYNKELADIKPYKVYEQLSFSPHNAEGGSKDKYITGNIPIQDIAIYQIRGEAPSDYGNRESLQF